MNEIELIGALFGIAGVWLTVKEKIGCFPLGIINVLITAYLVFSQKLYADTLQQVVYFILLMVGWVNWYKAGRTNTTAVTTMATSQRIGFLVIFISATSIMYLLLKFYTDAALPFWDSTGTVICFIAQYLVAKKKIENWLLWMIANTMYVGIFYVKGMEYYSILSIVYFVQAVFGWYDWRKNLIPEVISK